MVLFTYGCHANNFQFTIITIIFTGVTVSIVVPGIDSPGFPDLVAKFTFPLLQACVACPFRPVSWICFTVGLLALPTAQGLLSQTTGQSLAVPEQRERGAGHILRYLLRPI